MSAFILLTSGLSSWVVGSSSSLWTLGEISISSHISQAAVATVIQSISGDSTDPVPFIEGHLDAPANLEAVEELRFWLRSDRLANGNPNHPFYLIFEVSSSGSPSVWRRLLPIQQRGVWELHRLWLGDMPADLRQATETIRLRSLDTSLAFTASLGDILATHPTPLFDVDAYLVNHLHHRFQVPIDGVATDVPANISVPENPNQTIAFPSIVMMPWAIQPTGEELGELVDNYTATVAGDTAGAYVRPSPQPVRLQYGIDVFALERSHKSYLLEQIVRQFSQPAFVAINGERLALSPFTPSPQELAAHVAPGRTPLFYQLTAHIETGDRQFRPQASPFILAGPANGVTPEAIPV